MFSSSLCENQASYQSLEQPPLPQALQPPNRTNTGSATAWTEHIQSTSSYTSFLIPMVHEGGDSQFPRTLSQGPAEQRIHSDQSQLQSFHFSTVACLDQPDARPSPVMTKIGEGWGRACVPYRLRGDIDVGQIPVFAHNWEMAVYLNRQRVSCQNHDPIVRETPFLTCSFPLSVESATSGQRRWPPNPQGPQMRISHLLKVHANLFGDHFLWGGEP